MRPQSRRHLTHAITFIEAKRQALANPIPGALFMELQLPKAD
jgi:hypothetical protein